MHKVCNPQQDVFLRGNTVDNCFDFIIFKLGTYRKLPHLYAHMGLKWFKVVQKIVLVKEQLENNRNTCHMGLYSGGLIRGSLWYNKKYIHHAIEVVLLNVSVNTYTIKQV